MCPYSGTLLFFVINYQKLSQDRDVQHLLSCQTINNKEFIHRHKYTNLTLLPQLTKYISQKQISRQEICIYTLKLIYKQNHKNITMHIHKYLTLTTKNMLQNRYCTTAQNDIQVSYCLFTRAYCMNLKNNDHSKINYCIYQMKGD